MTFNDEELAVLASGVQNIGIFFRLDVEPVIRLWLGFGKVWAEANAFDPAGAEYTGFGELSSIPTITAITNGAAQRVEFTLSGVSGDVQQIAVNEDADDVKGKRAAVGIGICSSDFRLLGPLHWVGTYRADFLTIDQPANADGQVVRTITLSCGSLLTSRKRPSFSYFSDQDQQARSPGDNFCEFVQRYANRFNKKWPTFP